MLDTIEYIQSKKKLQQKSLFDESTGGWVICTISVLWYSNKVLKIVMLFVLNKYYVTSKYILKYCYKYTCIFIAKWMINDKNE